MVAKGKDYAALVRKVRGELGLSQEDFAHELGVSFATINRWENGQVKPSRLARVQIDAFCVRMAKEGRLKLPGNDA
jgi:DNA-binding transcriptional regulator YiaG